MNVCICARALALAGENSFHTENQGKYVFPFSLIFTEKFAEKSKYYEVKAIQHTCAEAGVGGGLRPTSTRTLQIQMSSTPLPYIQTQPHISCQRLVTITSSMAENSRECMKQFNADTKLPGVTAACALRTAQLISLTQMCASHRRRYPFEGVVVTLRMCGCQTP